MLRNRARIFTVAERRFSLFSLELVVSFDPQAAELAPALQTDGVIDVKEAIQGAIQGENGEVVQIVSSVATWTPRRLSDRPETPDGGSIRRVRLVGTLHRVGQAIPSGSCLCLFVYVVIFNFRRILIKTTEKYCFLFFSLFPFFLTSQMWNWGSIFRESEETDTSPKIHWRLWGGFHHGRDSNPQQPENKVGLLSVQREEAASSDLPPSPPDRHSSSQLVYVNHVTEKERRRKRSGAAGEATFAGPVRVCETLEWLVTTALLCPVSRSHVFQWEAENSGAQLCSVPAAHTHCISQRWALPCFSSLSFAFLLCFSWIYLVMLLHARGSVECTNGL